MRANTTYDREKLYEEVWARPMRELCKEYGVSDVALAKMCRKLGVPLPGRGHWAKVEAGQTPRRPPLPKPKPNERSRIVVSRRIIERPDEDEIENHPDVSEKVRAFLLAAKGVEVVDVPHRISRPHPLLVEDERNQKGAHDAFRVNASADARPRARRLLQGLAVELERLGCRVAASSGNRMSGFVDVAVGDATVSVRLRETLRQERVKETGLWAKFKEFRTDLVPTSQMELTIEGWFEGLPRRRWRDSENHLLEDDLPAAITGIGLALAMTDARNAERQREREEAARAHREAQERERLLAIERSMAADLERRAALLVVADRLEVFLKDPRVEGFRSGNDVDRAWLAWARTRVLAMTAQAVEAPLPEGAAGLLASRHSNIK